MLSEGSSNVLIGDHCRPKDMSLTPTWIEITLKDELDQPFSDELYEVILPDGSKKTGKLDASGTIRFQDISAGIARVFFPELICEFHLHSGF